MLSRPAVRRALNPPESFGTARLEKLDEFMLSSFQGEAVMIEESIQRFCTTIFYTRGKLIIMSDENRGLRGTHRQINC